MVMTALFKSDRKEFEEIISVFTSRPRCPEDAEENVLLICKISGVTWDRGRNNHPWRDIGNIFKEILKEAIVEYDEETVTIRDPSPTGNMLKYFQ